MISDDGLRFRGNDEFRIGVYFWDHSINRFDPVRNLAVETNKQEMR